jgi:hypothetical protein
MGRVPSGEVYFENRVIKNLSGVAVRVGMGSQTYLHLGSVHGVEAFQRYLREHSIAIPCDAEMIEGSSSPLAKPLEVNDRKIGNRFAIHPMEGWDGTADGKPTELTERRWRNFGPKRSKADLGRRSGCGATRRSRES